MGLLMYGDINEKNNIWVCKCFSFYNENEVFFLNLMFNRKYSFDLVIL